MERDIERNKEGKKSRYEGGGGIQKVKREERDPGEHRENKGSSDLAKDKSAQGNA